MKKVISDETWEQLVKANKHAVADGWASEGVFGPAVGPDYSPERGLLYVGKSAGPKGGMVGSKYDQEESRAASVDWMVKKRNNSDFWYVVNNIDFSRRSIAWTNVCKMDQINRKTLKSETPSAGNFNKVAKISFQALKEEILNIKPKVCVFVIHRFGEVHFQNFFDANGFELLETKIVSGFHRKKVFTATFVNFWSAPLNCYGMHAPHPESKSQNILDETVSQIKKLLASN